MIKIVFEDIEHHDGSRDVAVGIAGDWDGDMTKVVPESVRIAAVVAEFLQSTGFPGSLRPSEAFPGNLSDSIRGGRLDG